VRLEGMAGLEAEKGDKRGAQGVRKEEGRGVGQHRERMWVVARLYPS
jgi:hypothetical protein